MIGLLAAILLISTFSEAQNKTKLASKNNQEKIILVTAIPHNDRMLLIAEAFFWGSDFVSFQPYLREYKELLKYQWLITYRSGNTGKGFRRIEVTTDFDIHLHHPEGYNVK